MLKLAQTQTLSKSMLIHKHKVTQVIGAQICTPMAHNNDLWNIKGWTHST